MGTSAHFQEGGRHTVFSTLRFPKYATDRQADAMAFLEGHRQKVIAVCIAFSFTFLTIVVMPDIVVSLFEYFDFSDIGGVFRHLREVRLCPWSTLQRPTGGEAFLREEKKRPTPYLL